MSRLPNNQPYNEACDAGDGEEESSTSELSSSAPPSSPAASIKTTICLISFDRTCLMQVLFNQLGISRNACAMPSYMEEEYLCRLPEMSEPISYEMRRARDFGIEAASDPIYDDLDAILLFYSDHASLRRLVQRENEIKMVKGELPTVVVSIRKVGCDAATQETLEVEGQIFSEKIKAEQFSVQAEGRLLGADRGLAKVLLHLEKKLHEISVENPEEHFWRRRAPLSLSYMSFFRRGSETGAEQTSSQSESRRNT